MATPIYVATVAGGGSDANDGLTPTDEGGGVGPKLTFDAAITLVEDGGVVKVMPGTYSDYVGINDAGTAKNVTIESDSTQAVIETDLTYCVYISTTLMVNKVLTLSNINFSVAVTGNAFLEFSSTANGHVIFEDCIFTQHATNKPFNLRWGIGASGYDRYVTMRRCTFATDVSDAIDVGATSRWVIDDCDLTFTTNGHLDYCFNVTGDINEFVLVNSRIDFKSNLLYVNSSNKISNLIINGNVLTHSSAANNTSDIMLYLLSEQVWDSIQIRNNIINNTYVPDAGEISAETKYFSCLYFISTAKIINITGNIINTVYPNYYGTVFRVIGLVTPIIFNGNRIFDFDTALNSQSLCEVTNNVLDCASPLILSNPGNLIHHNTIIANDGHLDGRSMLFQRTDITAASSVNTTFAATTVTDGSAWDLSDAEERMICVIKAAPGDYVSTHWGYVKSVDNPGNKITVDKWTKVADSTVETPSNGAYAQVVVFATNNSVKYNIFDSRAARYGMNWDFMPMFSMDEVDYNCYVSGTDTFGNVAQYVNGQAAVISLEEQQDVWVWFAPAYPLNDANSIEEDPMYADLAGGDYAPTNPNLKLDDNTWMGAVKPGDDSIFSYGTITNSIILAEEN